MNRLEEHSDNYQEALVPYMWEVSHGRIVHAVLDISVLVLFLTCGTCQSQVSGELIELQHGRSYLRYIDYSLSIMEFEF